MKQEDLHGCFVGGEVAVSRISKSQLAASFAASPLFGKPGN
jgi:hypothetical protein